MKHIIRFTFLGEEYRGCCLKSILVKIIIIIIIKKDWQCKAGRGRSTPYQSEDPSPTLPTYRGKEEKGKIVEDKKEENNWANKKALDLLLKPANPTPWITGSTRSFQRDTEREISHAVLRGSAAGRRVSIPMCDQSTACNPAHKAQVERHKVGASGYT